MRAARSLACDAPHASAVEFDASPDAATACWELKDFDDQQQRRLVCVALTKVAPDGTVRTRRALWLWVCDTLLAAGVLVAARARRRPRDRHERAERPTR